MSTPVLDPASGSRMFYFDKADPRVTFGDIRTEDHVLCDGRALSIAPDVEMDFRERGYGRPAYVDTSDAVAHIRRLQAAGLGWKRIASMAGLDSSLLYPLLYGRPDRNGGQPRTKARPATVAAILAVPMPGLDQLGAVVHVPALGTRRRLQALTAAGWSINQIATRSGANRQALDRAILDTTQSVTATTARRIRDTYTRLENQAPPEATWHERSAAARARRRAQDAGWLAPAWWDPDTIDNPNHTPQPARGTNRHDTVRLHTISRLDDWIHLVEGGDSPDRAATRCGWTSLANLRTTATRTHHHAALTHLDTIATRRAEERAARQMSQRGHHAA